MQMQCSNKHEIPEETYNALIRVQAIQDVFFRGQGFVPDRHPEAIPAEASPETFMEILTDLFVAIRFHGEMPSALIRLALERANEVSEDNRN